MKKRILTSLLTATLVLSTVNSAPPVFAAENGTITIESTQKSATYSAYKVFEATVADASATNGAVAYTIPAGREEAYKASVNFSNLFETTKNGDKTYVTKKEGATDAAIAEWAKTVSAGQPTVATATETNGDGQETLSVPYGYYYVGTTANNGATIMVTSASPNATIREKNNEPTWGDGGGKTIDDKVKAVGETATYTLDYKNATYYVKGTKVYQYVVEDTLPTGVDFNEGTVVVTVNGETLSKTDARGNKTYQLTETDNGFKVVIPWAATETMTTSSGNVVANTTTAGNLGDKDDFYYAAISNIKVTYTGVVKKEASEGSTDTDTNKNLAKINPNTLQTDEGKSTHVYDGQITIDKIAAGNDAKKLKGAAFVLRKKNTENYLKLAETTENVTWVNREQAQVFTTNDQGAVVISGLDEGEYELIETVAPEGYNLLKTPVTVTLAYGKEGDTDKLLVTSKIENQTGTELPSTGGLGTTIFYTLGSLFVLGAGLVLVARRRLRH